MDVEQDCLRKLTFTFVPTGSSMTINMFAHVDSPKIRQALQSFRDLFSQENFFTFLIRGRWVNRVATKLQNKWGVEDNNNLNAKWFLDGNIIFEWASLREQNPDHRQGAQIERMIVFYSFEEYFTLQVFGIVQDFEYEWQNALALEANRDLTVTALTIPGAGNRRYPMFLDLTQLRGAWSLKALRRTAGDALKLDFFADDDLEDEERDRRMWIAHIQKSHPYAPSAHLTLIATRRWVKYNGWVADNSENPLRPMQYEDHHNSNILRSAICDAGSTRVRVSMVAPNQAAKKQLHALTP